MRLLCILDHPTQYDPPLWAALARRGVVEPEVWYGRTTAGRDPELGRGPHWSVGTSYARVVPDANVARRLRRLDGKPDAILTAGWTRPRAWYAWRAARAVSIPVVLPSDKTLNEPSPRQPLRAILTIAHAYKARLFDGFFTTGSLGRVALLSVGVPLDRITTGLYPVDVSWWQQQLALLKGEVATLRAAARSQFVVLAVSKLHARENPLLVIEGFAELHARLPASRLVFVGDGPMRRDVESRLLSLGIGQAVTLAGYVPYTQLAAYYGAADVFVHVPKREPWGISVSEAMACGLPVVASTAVGAAADLVVPGRTGYLVPPDDRSALTRALLSLAQGDGAELAREYARRHVMCVDVETVAGRLEGLLKRLRARRYGQPLGAVLADDLRNRWGRWSA